MFLCKYKNISHVGMYVGNGKVVEAYSESVGVIYGDVTGKNNIVNRRERMQTEMQEQEEPEEKEQGKKGQKPKKTGRK